MEMETDRDVSIELEKLFCSPKGPPPSPVIKGENANVLYSSNTVESQNNYMNFYPMLH